MKLAIKSLKGEIFYIEADPTDTVLALKSKIQDDKSDYAIERQKLIFTGKVLKDTQTISELNLKESDFIVCMVSGAAAKPKPSEPAPSSAPIASQPPPSLAVAPTVTTPSVPTPIPAPTAAPTVNNESLQNLVSMGFPENESRAALLAAQGNPNLAYEFLITGIPEVATPAPSQSRTSQQIAASTGSALDKIRSHPQFNDLKQIVQQNPAALPQVLNLIGQQDPQLLAAIHENNEAFVAMMNEPISATPAQPAAAAPMGMGMGGMPSPAQLTALLSTLAPDQRAQFAQSVGMTPEQLQAFVQVMSSLPPEQLQQLGAMGGGGGGGHGHPQGNSIALTESEMQAVTRLQQLGFSQQQAVQAYLACDKNENLAANFLFDGGFDDDGAYGYEGGEGGEGDGHEDEYN